VAEVTEWLENIGLGHKEDLVESSDFNGKKLDSASADDLKAISFTKLQAKKLLRELEGNSTTTTMATKTDGISATTTPGKSNSETRNRCTTGNGDELAATTKERRWSDSSPTITSVPFCSWTIIEG